MHSFFNHQLLLIFAVLVCGCAQPKSDDETASSAAATRFKLVASGDTHGWIMPCGCTSNQSGGLLRRGSYVENLREESDVLLVDVGGAADGTAPYQLEKFRAVLAGEKLMEITAHNLGAAEVAFGAETLRSLSKTLEIPFLSANVQDEKGKPLFETHRLHIGAGYKLLLVGVVSAQHSGPGLKVTDPAAAIFEVLKTIDEEYDWLVVLAYLDEAELRNLAAVLPEAHAIIGGPTNQSLAPEKIGPVLLTSATNKGKFLAELVFDNAEKSIAAKIVEMSPEFIDEPQQTKNLETFREILARKDFKASESGLLKGDRWAVSLTNNVAGTRSCRECHEETCEEWDDSGHAHAWERLVSEEAHFDSYCQQCHTTGYGWPAGFVSAKLSQQRVNVGCESCHGPSLEHANDSAVKTAFDAQGQCLKCHDPENSPTFEYASYWEKITHE